MKYNLNINGSKAVVEADDPSMPLLYALRNDADRTFEWLDRAWSKRDPGIEYLLTDPLILRFRDDPRFAAFCRKVGLPTTTTAKATEVPALTRSKT